MMIDHTYDLTHLDYRVFLPNRQLAIDLKTHGNYYTFELDFSSVDNFGGFAFPMLKYGSLSNAQLKLRNGHDLHNTNAPYVIFKQSIITAGINLSILDNSTFYNSSGNAITSNDVSFSHYSNGVTTSGTDKFPIYWKFTVVSNPSASTKTDLKLELFEDANRLPESLLMYGYASSFDRESVSYSNQLNIVATSETDTNLYMAIIQYNAPLYLKNWTSYTDH